MYPGQMIAARDSADWITSEIDATRCSVPGCDAESSTITDKEQAYGIVLCASGAHNSHFGQWHKAKFAYDWLVSKGLIEMHTCAQCDARFEGELDYLCSDCR